MSWESDLSETVKAKIPETGIIYGLVDPITSKLRYVGCTINLKRRVKAHLQEAASHTTTHRTAWIKGLLLRNLTPLVIVLEMCSSNDLFDREREYITSLRQRGYELVNSTDGGDGLRNPTKTTREKMSAANKARGMSGISKLIAGSVAYHTGRPQTPEHIEKRVSQRRGKPSKIADKLRERMRRLAKLRIGSHLPESTRLKLSQAKMGHSVSQETREKISTASKSGTPEVKAKISAAIKKIVTKDHLQRMTDLAVQAVKGKPFTEEHKRKISEAHKRRQERIRNESFHHGTL
jgi:hypothetical protein